MNVFRHRRNRDRLRVTATVIVSPVVQRKWSVEVILADMVYVCVCTFPLSAPW